MPRKLHSPESNADYDTATLIEPADSGYILIAAEVDQRLPCLPPSRAKRSLLNDCSILCRAFERKTQVAGAAVFSALLAPPGSGRLARQRPKQRTAAFWDGLLDVVPSLLLKPSFRSYVLKSFAAGNTVSMPLLYRLA